MAISGVTSSLQPIHFDRIKAIVKDLPLLLEFSQMIGAQIGVNEQNFTEGDKLKVEFEWDVVGIAEVKAIGLKFREIRYEHLIKVAGEFGGMGEWFLKMSGQAEG